MIPFDEAEILLIGAGPIGLEMAAALKVNGFDYRHLEAGNIASTIHWYAPGTLIFSSPERLAIAGVPFSIFPQTRATREDYLTYLRGVASHFRLKIDTYRRVVDIRRATYEFVVDTALATHGVGGPAECVRPEHAAPVDKVIACRKIILAIGDMHRPRLCDVPGEDLPFVSHYLDDLHLYFGQRVVIVGAKNSAAEAAVRLDRQFARVTICCRGPDLDETRIKPWLIPELRLLVKERKMDLLTRVGVDEITPGRVRLRNLDSGATTSVPCDQVLLLTGYEQDKQLFEQAGVELAGEGRVPVYNAETMETNVPGIFVAGTCSAGTQIGGVTSFVETSHIHVKRIIEALGGKFFDYDAHVRPVNEREQ